MKPLTSTTNRGNTVVIAVLLVVILAVGGFLLYEVMKPSTSHVATQTTNTATDDVPNPPTIATTADLDTALTVMDRMNLNAQDSDSDSLNASVDEF